MTLVYLGHASQLALAPASTQLGRNSGAQGCFGAGLALNGQPDAIGLGNALDCGQNEATLSAATTASGARCMALSTA